MGKNKFGTYIVLGALLGGAASLLDRSTRNQVVGKSKKMFSTVRYYSQNTDALKLKIQEKKDKYETMYEKFSEDASYIKEKVDEIKQLTPQVKELVVDTKEAFVESKDEYKAIVNEQTQDELGKH
ncbi:YtxH domain-containing protein [Sporosarcina pasteurii]|uniref:Gas vesicle protein n=1 Tax=Sporosarcina pasteurii TaxID=1474 RepID=A0A380CAS8_SPOPA|nr:YtxH domain-containing protein [Sporosarcina pasteurii]MDS9473341.1 YtxH domain-containing protein [Sporosarcina pasteurii]QBQ04277.1 YtxH domain-containing protein [Sporosarcina pasteurii]SUJ16738.1 Uncharacterised protein [Sporosarcina pasteurii]